MTAGIYARMCGIECTIYEQHTILGGELTGWRREGCMIDNCVHWMIGTDPKSDIHNTWRETGVLVSDDGEDVLQNEAFMRVETRDGRALNMWQNLDRLREDMVRVSPEDERMIDEFVEDVKAYRCVDLPAKKPVEQLSVMELLRLARGMKAVVRRHRKLTLVSVADYALRFNSPVIRRMLTTYFPVQYNISSLMYVLAHFSMGNAALPRGGSLAMAQRLERKFRQLGGEVRTNYRAERIEIEDRKAQSIVFANGETVAVDMVVCACDTDVTFGKLIGMQYMDKMFRMWYQWNRKYPVHSSVNFYFQVSDLCRDVPDTVAFECEPYILAGENRDSILLKNYNSEPGFAPEGNVVWQTLHLQYAPEYEFWTRLRASDLQAYRREKQRAASEIIARLEQHYPSLKGKIKCIEAVTPASFARFCGAYKGAYMSFILTPYAPKVVHKGVLKGIDNLYLAGQWLQPPGGLPNAHLTGKYAIQRLCKREKIPFYGYGGRTYAP